MPSKGTSVIFFHWVYKLWQFSVRSRISHNCISTNTDISWKGVSEPFLFQANSLLAPGFAATSTFSWLWAITDAPLLAAQETDIEDRDDLGGRRRRLSRCGASYTGTPWQFVSNQRHNLAWLPQATPSLLYPSCTSAEWRHRGVTLPVGLQIVMPSVPPIHSVSNCQTSFSWCLFEIRLEFFKHRKTRSFQLWFFQQWHQIDCLWNTILVSGTWRLAIYHPNGLNDIVSAYVIVNYGFQAICMM